MAWYVWPQILQENASCMGKQLFEEVGSRKSKVESKERSCSIEMDELFIDGYERVIEVRDRRAGLHAFIAVHNTNIGPALGGTRIYPYAKREDALQDALRLAKGMTYKAAISGLGLGGGKSVIIADPKRDKTPELLMAFGMAVDMLGGSYICAEDVGCTTEDVKWIRKTTKYVVGLTQEKSSGDPGLFTAWGVFRGIQSVLKKLYGSDSVEGKTIAVQGLGNVGGNLVDRLFWAGAELILSDIDKERLAKFCQKYGARAVSADKIAFAECDVFAPCALGGILNDETIPLLRCKGIAGGANNQLLHDKHGEALRERGILYAPDFVINAGGLLNVEVELDAGGYTPAIPRAKCSRIYDTLLSIYEIAEKNSESTHKAAVDLAAYRIKYGVGRRTIAPIFHHNSE